MDLLFYSVASDGNVCVKAVSVRLITPIVIFIGIAAALGYCEPSFTDALAARGKIAIPVEQARRLESKLGQLFIVNVDGFGYSGPLALEPGFTSLVERLQVGGVIAHYGSTNYEKIRRTNRALSALTELPLLLCCDIVKLKGAARIASFGDGYIGGFLGKFRRLPDSEFQILARLNAFALAAIGINVALGPTVDDSTGDPRTPGRARLVTAQMRSFGLQPVLKHFPYLPARANLHRESPDTRVPLPEAEKRFAVFRDLAGEADIMMTTHLYDSLVDRSLVTFSPVWNRLLREKTRFEGLLMSDGLLMLKNYADRSMLTGGPAGADVSDMDETAVWALRAILAGHDMIIIEGSAAQTYRAFEGLLAVACRDTALGRALRARIDEAWRKIAGWKEKRGAALRRVVDTPASAVQAMIDILPAEGSALESFRFDAKALTRLQPALQAVEAR